MSLRSHNQARAGHGVDPLHWSDALAVSAEQTCRRVAGVGYEEGVVKEQAGLNVFQGKDIHQTDKIAEFAVRSWYKSVQFYNYTASVFVGKSGEFTQMIWKRTKFVGCGFAKSQMIVDLEIRNCIYFCCQYLVHGNVARRFGDNVLPPSKHFNHLWDKSNL